MAISHNNALDAYLEELKASGRLPFKDALVKIVGRLPFHGYFGLNSAVEPNVDNDANIDRALGCLCFVAEKGFLAAYDNIPEFRQYVLTKAINTPTIGMTNRLDTLTSSEIKKPRELDKPTRRLLLNMATGAAGGGLAAAWAQSGSNLKTSDKVIRTAGGAAIGGNISMIGTYLVNSAESAESAEKANTNWHGRMVDVPDHFKRFERPEDMSYKDVYEVLTYIDERIGFVAETLAPTPNTMENSR